MSIAVALADVAVTLESYPWGYLVTVSDDGRAHSLAVPTVWNDGALHATVGRSTRVNAVARPNVTMVFPPTEAGGHSLIVDADVVVVDDVVVLTPTSAVLHRPAIR